MPPRRSVPACLILLAQVLRANSRRVGNGALRHQCVKRRCIDGRACAKSDPPVTIAEPPRWISEWI